MLLVYVTAISTCLSSTIFLVNLMLKDVELVIVIHVCHLLM